MKLVSVIIPVYNVDEYLVKCLDSVRNQSYRNLEVILVDDGSTDKSPELCDCFAKIDPRISVIHKENGGLSSARNAGLDRASGEYICFLDSDDYIESVLVEKTVNAMESSGSDWCGFCAIKEKTDGERLYRIAFEEGVYPVSSDDERLSFLIGKFLNYKVGWEACFHLYKKSVIEKSQLRFYDERRIFAEDLLFSFCYLLKADRIAILPDDLYHYVEREGSLLKQSKSRNVLPKLHCLLESLHQFVKKSGCIIVQEHFSLIYLLLMEWHMRQYMIEEGMFWVKYQMKKLAYQTFVPDEYLQRGLKNDLRMFGSICGVISVVIPIHKNNHKKAVRYVEALLRQTIQRLDLMLVCEESCKELEDRDIRIRQFTLNRVDPGVCLEMGFQEGYGEFLYLGDVDQAPETDFLRYMSDAIKYNQCETGILYSKIEGQVLYKNDTCMDRKKVRSYLNEAGNYVGNMVFKRDLLKKSGLACFSPIESYLKNMILSGSVIFLKETR